MASGSDASGSESAAASANGDIVSAATGNVASVAAAAKPRAATRGTEDRSSRIGKGSGSGGITCEYAGREGLVDMRGTGLDADRRYQRVRVLSWFSKAKEWLVVRVIEKGKKMLHHVREKAILWCGTVSETPYEERQKVRARWTDGFYYGARIKAVHPAGCECGGCGAQPRDVHTYDVIFEDDNQQQLGLRQDEIWERDTAATTWDLKLLPVAQRLGKVCTQLCARYADLAWQGEGAPAYTCEMDEERLCYDAIGAVVERMHLLNDELPISSSLPVTMFTEDSVQGTRQCVGLLRTMTRLCNDSLQGKLQFPDPNRPGQNAWLNWDMWFSTQEKILSQDIQQSPTADFVKSCCTLCNQVTAADETEPHPLFANRRICRRAECRGRVALGFQHSFLGGYSECMVCLARGRLVECCNSERPDRKCPWSVCVGCLFYQEKGQQSIWEECILDDDEEESSWMCFVCRRDDLEGGRPGPSASAPAAAAAATAAAAENDVQALQVRSDWDPRTVPVRALEAWTEVETDDEVGQMGYGSSESSGSEDFDDADYSNADQRKRKRGTGRLSTGNKRRRRKSLKRTGTTPRKGAAARRVVTTRMKTADPKRTYRRPIALFEISFQKGEEAGIFARDAGLEHWAVNAALVSAAPRERHFFSQKRPSVPLQVCLTSTFSLATHFLILI